MKRRGFTLVELLAVIVILGIILAIAIPSITSLIGNATQNSFSSDAKMVIKGVNNALLINDSLDLSTISFDSASNQANTNARAAFTSKTGISDADYDSIKVTKVSGKINVVLVGSSTGKWSGLIAYGASTSMTTAKTSTFVGFNDTTGASAPELASNMIPVMYNGTNWVKADVNNLVGTNAWYNYANKQWANAVTVTSSSLAGYKSAAVGTTVSESDILTYLVWIPRYSYAIPSGTGARTINILFEGNTKTKSSGDTTGTNYLTHPAFTFGTKELNGFWVGKFETTGTINAITVKPNLTSLRNFNVSSFYTAIRNMSASGNSYGFSSNEVDTHMVKNSEWGAVAYLSASTYGKTGEIWINNSNAYTTGCAGASVSVGTYGSCDNAYNTSNGVNASTTGNIYGIYDMSGGSFEFVMGNYSNYSGLSSSYNSGFNGSYGGGGSLTTGLSFPDSKYYNLYSTNDFTTACNGGKCYGQALSETSGWYNDSAEVLDSSNSWLARGGYYSNGTLAGAFSACRVVGAADSVFSTRVVVALNY